MNLEAAVEARIEEVRDAFLAEGGGRTALALYLMGGFARGEGTADLQLGRLRVYNDLDLLVVLRRRTPNALLRLWRILRRLNDGRFDHQVDLEVATPEELRATPSTIREADLRNRRRWLWGEDALADLPTAEGEALRSGDAVQLLLNRQASGLYGLKEAMADSPRIPYFQVQISKPLLAMAAAALALDGRYVTAAADQLQRLKVGSTASSDLPTDRILSSPETLGLLATAVEFKARPRAEHFFPYGETLEKVLGLYHTFLMATLHRLYGAPAAQPDLRSTVEAFRRSQPVSLRLLTSSWWAHFLRSKTAGVPTSPPSRGAHPLVDVYAAHTLWLGEYLYGEPTSWRRFVGGPSAFPPDDSRKLEIRRLIEVWNAASYGCRLD